MEYELTFPISNFSLASTWSNNASGAIVSGPSLAAQTIAVSVEGIVVGSRIQSVLIRATTGNTTGGARVLDVHFSDFEGEPARMTPQTENEVGLTSENILTEDGTYNLVFRFQDNGRTGMSEGTHTQSMTFSSVSLVVKYLTDVQPTPGPIPPPRPTRTDAPENAITLHDGLTRGLIAVLHPSECVITEEAGGEYELSMTYPMDGVWREIVPERIIRAPVPHMHIDAVMAQSVTMWEVTPVDGTTKVPLWKIVPTVYTKKNSGAESVTGLFNWDSTKSYTAGWHVIYQSRVYVCAHDTGTSHIPPVGAEQSGYYWSYVSTVEEYAEQHSQGGGTIVRTAGEKIEDLNEGTKMVKLGDLDQKYMLVRATTGKMGYIEKAKCTELQESSSIDTTIIPEHDIKRQYFRIYGTSISSDDHTVTVNARHISYDADMLRLKECATVEASAAIAVQMLQQCYIMTAASMQDEDISAEDRIIATDITDGKITADWSWASPISAICDPESGIVSQVRARLIRDNDDILILSNDRTTNGAVIKYGVNLIGVTVSVDNSELVTRIIPVGKAEDDSKLYLPESYMDSEHIYDYPLIRYEVLEVSAKVGQEVEQPDSMEKKKYTDEDVFAKMREEGQKRYDKDFCDLPQMTVDVEFLLLGDTEEYRQYRGLQRLNLYDLVRVQHEQMGIDVALQVSGYEWDAIMRRYNGITLGNPWEYGSGTVSGYQIGSRAISERALSPGLKTLLGV